MQNKKCGQKQQLIDAEDKLAVNIGLEILKIVPGRISTEVDARYSYDTHATVEKARNLFRFITKLAFQMIAF